MHPLASVVKTRLGACGGAYQSDGPTCRESRRGFKITLRKMPTYKILSSERAKRFYDWVGAKQDTQCFYERPALADLIVHLELARAESVIEFGCGTGRLAEELLDRNLSRTARYVGLDLSTTMIGLAQSRTARFGGRVAILQTNGTTHLDFPDGAFDRFISTYVLDLLSEKDIDSLLSQACRVLANRGLLGVVSLTRGSQGLSRFVTWSWERLHQFSPMLMGGCRPISVRPRLDDLRWKVRHRNVVTPFAIASEIVVAEKI
jgi:ubiquinone/menaquinone biosynthesis C-methylase UbiE